MGVGIDGRLAETGAWFGNQRCPVPSCQSLLLNLIRRNKVSHLPISGFLPAFPLFGPRVLARLREPLVPRIRSYCRITVTEMPGENHLGYSGCLCRFSGNSTGLPTMRWIVYASVIGWNPPSSGYSHTRGTPRQAGAEKWVTVGQATLIIQNNYEL